MTIGERIRNRREYLGMSQEELAQKLGYKSRSSINKIELGFYNLKQTKIKAIADALDTTPSYIMGWDSPDEENKKSSSPETVDERTREFIDLFSRLTAEEQNLFLAQIKGVLASR